MTIHSIYPIIIGGMEVKKMEIKKLNAEKLANTLLQVPLVSMQLNHKHIKGSLRDYVSPSEENYEGQFVKDLFTLETDQIIEKWYGGKEEARSILRK